MSTEMEKFRLDTRDDVSAESVQVRPGNVLVAVRNPNRLQHLERILEKTDTRKMDIVVLSVRNVTQAGAGSTRSKPSRSSPSDETTVFTRVVTLAEKAGKHVELMVVPGVGSVRGGVQTAARLQSSRIVMGLSPKLTPREQGAQVGALLGDNCPSRGRRCRSKSCWKTRRTWCSSTWGRIRRGCGRRISTWRTGCGWN